MSQTIEHRIERIMRGKVPEKYRKRACGIVPCDWAEYSLGEIYKERKLAGDPKLPILTVSIHSGVSDGALSEDELGKKVKRIEDKTQYKTAKAGDLVFNMMRAWQGAIGVARSNGLVSPAYIVAKPKREIYPLFMDYYMKQPRMVNIIHRQSYGVTDFRLRLYWDSFAQIQVSLPPLAEQKRIVEILSTQDKIIELLEKKVEQLQLMKKSYMQRMFPQPGSNEPEIRFPGFAGPWRQRKLRDIVKRITRKNQHLETKLPLTISAQHGLIDQNEFFDKKVASEDVSGYYLIKNGEFAYNKSTSLDAPWGAIKRLEKYEMGVLSTLYIVFSIQNEKEIDSDYLVTYYDTNLWHKGIRAVAAEGARNHGLLNISSDDFFEMTLPVPESIEEQERIGQLFQNLGNLISLHQRKRDEEVRKKQALMQLLLTGIVRVNA